MKPWTTPELDSREIDALRKWGSLKPAENILAAAMAARDVERAAMAFGPKLLAQMVLAGRLRPDQDPAEALAVLIDTADGCWCGGTTDYGPNRPKRKGTKP